MLTMAPLGTAVYETELQALKRDIPRASISSMSNSELLRFGVNVKFRISQAPASGNRDFAGLEAQLTEARLEWNRRHPNLPLRDSF
jgi:hypothetical protein